MNYIAVHNPLLFLDESILSLCWSSTNFNKYFFYNCKAIKFSQAHF